jgi:DNA (cytosine-5)-methyltransferase 1
MSPPLTVGSLFTGIAGLDLGLERAGMRVVWQSEIEPYCCRVLEKHYPHVPNLGDITQIDWSRVERPDLVCGGYPCQPFSFAGARRGEDDPRHLWPHFATCLRVLRPGWVLLENVPGILTLGFGQVAADLAALGYDLEWECLPAAAVGAPHLRYRIFVVAHASDTDRDREHARPLDAEMASTSQPVADTKRFGAGGPRRTDLTGHGQSRETVRQSVRSNSGEDVADSDQARCPDVFGGATLAQRPGWGAADGAGWWESEPDMGRVAHGIPHRVDRLRALGNAVVPQVAEYVGRQIVEAAS